MSRGPSKKCSSNVPPKERIIPIQLEGEESKVVTASSSSIMTRSRKLDKHEDQSTPQKQLQIENDMESKDEVSSTEDEDIPNLQSLRLENDKLNSSFNLTELSGTELITDIPQRSLPSYNVPEKIIIVLDRANDENCTYFEMTSGKKYSPLFMLQHALQIFLHNKAFIDNRHEYALICLNENSATWVHDFTNAQQDIIASVQTLAESPCEPEDIFDLNSVFDIINKKVDVSSSCDDPSVPPSEVVRTVLLYGRSYSIPQLSKTDAIEKLLNYPYFTVDVVMTHEPPDTANHCEKIFKALQEIDIKGFAYSFSISRNASELHCAMAKLLSHPLQRPHQLSAKYDINLFK